MAKKKVKKTVKRGKEFEAKVEMEFIGEVVIRPATENDFFDNNTADFAYVKTDGKETTIYKEYKKDGFRVEKKIIFGRGGIYYIGKQEKVKK
jgi:hypothetical protein